MSVATLPSIDPTAKPVRVPKLAVRNKSIQDDDAATKRPATAKTVATTGSGDNAGQARSESSSLRAPSPGSGRRLSDQSGSGSSGLTQRTALRDRPSTANRTVETSKKKKGSMLGFLTMKEPSALALEAFAEAERKKAQEKGSKGNLSGVSSRKLPEHVPKVNSKWDGLPERTSAEGKSVRSRGNSTATSGRRPSAYSSWSNRSDENKRPIGSLSSRPPQSPQSVQRSSLQSRGTVRSTHSTRAPIPSDNVHPAFRPIAVEETPENLPQTFLYPPSPPRQRQSPPRNSPKAQQFFAQELPATFGPVPELDTHDGPLPELESSLVLPELDGIRSKNATPVPKSPITPDAGEDLNATVYYSSDGGIASAHDPRHSGGDASHSFFYSQSDTDHEDLARSSTPKQLRQPINFSRRRSGRARPPSLGKLPEAPAKGFTYYAEDGITFSPTLKNSDGRIDPFLTDTFAAHSRATGRIVQRQTSVGKQQQPPSIISEHPPSSLRGEPAADPTRASTSTYLSTTTTASTSTALQSPVFSTFAPTDAPSTRPSTATSHHTTATMTNDHPRATDLPDEPDFEPYYTSPNPNNLTPDPKPSTSDHSAHNIHLNRAPSTTSLTPSLAPSTMSLQWHQTPQERLGLGGPRIRRHQGGEGLLPWETGEDTADNAEVLLPGSGPRSPGLKGFVTGAGGPRSPTTGTVGMGLGGGDRDRESVWSRDSKLKRLSYRWGGGGGGKR